MTLSPLFLWNPSYASFSSLVQVMVVLLISSSSPWQFLCRGNWRANTIRHSWHRHP
jgi:hypothetical protein